MTGITITIPPTADERDVADLCARLGIHGVAPENLLSIHDEGDCWVAVSIMTEGSKVRMVAGAPLLARTRHDKTPVAEVS